METSLINSKLSGWFLPHQFDHLQRETPNIALPYQSCQIKTCNDTKFPSFSIFKVLLLFLPLNFQLLLFFTSFPRLYKGNSNANIHYEKVITLLKSTSVDLKCTWTDFQSTLKNVKNGVEEASSRNCTDWSKEYRGWNRTFWLRVIP